MSLKRSSSVGSEGSDASGASGGSGFSDSSRQSASSAAGAAGGGGDKPDELLEENQSIMKGVFGVLFTLSKEKVDTSKRFVVAKLFLEWIQFLFLILHPAYGWHIDPDMWVWKIIDVINFKNPIINQGYSFYIGILYTVSVLLVLSIALCVWVGYCFQLQRFPFVWPIQVLRVFVSVFFMVFYIASLGVFLVAINCQWLGGAPYYLDAFPEVECLAMPHIIHMAVASVLMILFIIITVAATAADFELNPTSPRWLAAATSTVEVRVVMVRTVATLAFSILWQLRRPEVLLIACSVFYACWSFIRWQPHMFQWVNHVRSGIFGSLSWAAFLLLILTFSGKASDEDFGSSLTTAMLAGLLPFGVLCMAISYFRYRWTYTRALEAFKAAPLDQNPREIWRWSDIAAVEMCSRICRVPDAEDDEKQDEASVKLAERVFKGGMAFFSGKADMIILYANFMIEVSHQAAAGHSQLVAAKNLKPNIVQQFAIFVREQVHMQAAQTQASGEGSTDLVSYVEFQKHQRLLARSHRQALLATRSFWRLLMDKEVSFTALSQAFNTIEESHARADKTYKTVLERYSSSAKVLRMYAHFLEEVKNDPWTAEKFLAESEKLEEQQAAAENSALLGGTEGGAVDARNSPVVVINAQGIIQMANKMLLTLYGYKRGELDGKNVSVLMPQPFSGRHNTYLRNYLTTGKAKILDSVRSVLGLHRERYVFPTRILVSKVSGDGMDSVFMSVFKQVPEDKSVVHAYVATGGSVLCCDLRFLDWFGRNPADLQGKPFHTLGVEQGQLEQLVSLAAETSEADLNEGKVGAQGVHILHRYSTPVEVDITLELGGTENNRILIYNIKRRQTADLMIAADAKGKVVYCTTNMAEMLHYESRQMHGLYVKDLIAQPFAQLHSKFMKNSSARIPPGSCRGGATVVMVDAVGTGVPVRCEIMEREIEEKQFHVIAFHRSSFDAGVQQQRLRLKLDAARPGIVSTDYAGTDQSQHSNATVSGSGAPGESEEGQERPAAQSAAGAFGQRQSMYASRHLSSFIDVFRMAREKEGGTVASCTALLEKMIAITRERSGMAFRVGVHPPVEEAKLANPNPSAATAAATAGEKGDERTGTPKEGKEGGQRAIDVHAMERQMLRRETKPAILRLEIIKIGEGEEAEEELYIDLYNAHAMTGIIEINRSGIITKPGCCAMHVPGPLFGVMSRAMNTKSIRKYLSLPHGTKVVKSLMTTETKKKTRGALKNSHDSKTIGPLKFLDGIHVDGRPLRLEVECVLKDDASGSKNRYSLRVKLHKPTPGPKDFAKLVDDLHVSYVEKASHAAATALGGEESESSDSEFVDDGNSHGPSRMASGIAAALGSNGLPELRSAGLLPGSEPASPKDLLGLEGRRLGSRDGPRRSPAPGGIDEEGGDPGAEGLGVRDSPTLGARGLSNIVDSARPSPDGEQGEAKQGNATPVGAGGKAVEFPSGTANLSKGRRASFQLLGGAPQPGDDAAGPALLGRPQSPAVVRNSSPVQLQLRGRASFDVPSGNPVKKMAAGEADGDGSASEGGASESEEGRSGSEYSGKSGGNAASSTAGQELQSDYRRGKRNKRLQALLSSRKAQAIIVRFRNHSFFVTLLLLCVHVACFVILFMTITTQKEYLRELSEAGDGVVHMHTATLWVRVMDTIYRNQSAGSLQPPIYSPADKVQIARRLEHDLDLFEAVHHGVYLGFSKLRRLNNGDNYELRTIWEAPQQVTYIWVDSYQSYEEQLNMTLWTLGNDFIAAAREVMANAPLMAANATISENRNFHFVIKNGPGALYFAYKAMLDHLVNRCLAETGVVKNTLMVLLVVEACVLVMAANAYLIHLLSKVGSYRFHVYSIFLVIPTALLRALASKKVTIDGEDDEDEEEEEQQQQQQQQQGGAQKSSNAKDKGASGTVMAISAARHKDKGKHEMVEVKTGGGGRLLERVKGWFGLGNRQRALGSKKRLVKSPFDSFSLLVPFLLWALLIIVIYPLSYATLSDLDSPVAMVNVANFLAFRVRRSIFYVNEACSVTDVDEKAATLQSLKLRTADFKKEWASAMFGPSEEDRIKEPHFSKASSFTFQGVAEQTLLYRTHACLRNGGALYEGPCFTEDEFYYEITHQGLAGLIDRAIEECDALTYDSFADMHLRNARLDYIWRVGLFDLADALDTLCGYAIELASSKLNKVMTINIILLVLSILLVAFFLLFMVQPFLDRARKESRRVAELLSQLPPELNVEKLVLEALAGSGLHAEEALPKGMDGSGHNSRDHHQDGPPAQRQVSAKNLGGGSTEDPSKGKSSDGEDDDKASVASST